MEWAGDAAMRTISASHGRGPNKGPQAASSRRKKGGMLGNTVAAEDISGWFERPALCTQLRK
eukprot:5596718-Alexandrium_andersonii.AAC.1